MAALLQLGLTRYQRGAVSVRFGEEIVARDGGDVHETVVRRMRQLFDEVS
jgi:hypothetical protein